MKPPLFLIEIDVEAKPACERSGILVDSNRTLTFISQIEIIEIGRFSLIHTLKRLSSRIALTKNAE